MKNRYDITKYALPGTSFIEVKGASFSREDLYEMVGKEQYMSTFTFKPGTEASIKFGPTVTGIICYDKDEISLFRRLDKEVSVILEDGRVRIESPMRELTISQREDLKYGGVSAIDIEHISFIPYKEKVEHHESGEKKVPNIIYIPYKDDPQVDYDILYQNYIASKINSGVVLIQYEIEKFIGITLGINDGHIDSRLLKYLGYDIEKVRSCENIWYHIYKAKERRKTISEEEKSKLKDLEFIRKVEVVKRLFSELAKSGVNSDELSKRIEVFEIITSSIRDFEPSILLHGKKQIFWDIDSYLHIILRHVKQLQLGNYKTKSPFPYKFEDLQILIEQVLGRVEEEIERHFRERPAKAFKRVGRMSVLFNGDYYCIQIDGNGRLENFYITAQNV